MKKVIFISAISFSLITAMNSCEKQEISKPVVKSQSMIIVNFSNVLSEANSVQNVTFRFSDGTEKTGIVKDSRAYLSLGFLQAEKSIMSIIVERVNILNGKKDFSIISKEVAVNPDMKPLMINVNESMS